MSESNSYVQNVVAIDEIHKMIEFEIQNANSQLSLYKKDNINLILLLLALIGFFAIVPLDIFAYKWFECAIFLILVVSFTIILVLLKREYRSRKKKNEISVDSECGNCESCIDYTICKNLGDPQKRKEIVTK